MVIIMRYFQDLSIAETAEILGWTEGKVKTTQHRAIKVFTKEIECSSSRRGETDDRKKVGRQTD